MNNALLPLIRPHYLKMNGYISAGMETAKSVDNVYLNANENPYELPGLEHLNRYPEPQPTALAEAYAQTYGVENTQIVMTRGADEAIALLTKIFCTPEQDAIVISSPTFGMYGVNAHAMPARLIDVPLQRTEGTFTLDRDTLIATAKDPKHHVKLIYICSPNNPTGTSFSHETISEICEAVEGHAVVILDETYAEFSQAGSMVDDLASTPNLIILRTLSKSYALAAMRMGCILCGDEDFTAMIKAKALDAYPLPQISIEAAFHVLSPEIRTIAMDNIFKLIDERKRMEDALPKASTQIKHIYPSDANFLLIEMEHARDFIAHCAAHNFILRDFSQNPETKDCIRLSIGLPEDNDRVLDLLSQFQPAP